MIMQINKKNCQTFQEITNQNPRFLHTDSSMMFYQPCKTQIKKKKSINLPLKLMIGRKLQIC